MMPTEFSQKPCSNRMCISWFEHELRYLNTASHLIENGYLYKNTFLHKQLAGILMVQIIEMFGILVSCLSVLSMFEIPRASRSSTESWMVFSADSASTVSVSSLTPAPGFLWGSPVVGKIRRLLDM